MNLQTKENPTNDFTEEGAQATMVKKVLVAYATKHGATAEIAERIGETLCQADVPAEVLLVPEVSDLMPYTAVILGSAVYIGQWCKESIFSKCRGKPPGGSIYGLGIG